jgi:SAM-dependent methyltransferase
LHPTIHGHFEQLFAKYAQEGVVLELGAPEDPGTALLPTYQRYAPTSRCIGVNLAVHQADGVRPYELIEGNANDLSAIPDGSITAVLTNAMLEHDRRFWSSLAEARRVLAPGGLLFVGVPGFRRERNVAQRALGALAERTSDLPAVHRVCNRLLNGTAVSATSTYMFHAAPHDYWRFSEQAVKEVFFEGFDCLELAEVMTPPRVIAVGRKVAPTTAAIPLDARSTKWLALPDWSCRADWTPVLLDYIERFGPDDDVTLVLRSDPVNGYDAERVLGELSELLDGLDRELPDILVTDDSIGRVPPADLLTSVDAYLATGEPHEFDHMDMAHEAGVLVMPRPRT